MSRRFRLITRCFGLLLFLSLQQLNAQILQDTSALNLVRKEIDYIYNQEFDKALPLLAEIRNRYPDHPIVSLISGMSTYWKNYPLIPRGPSHELFEEDLRKCIKLSEETTDKSFEAEFLLTNLCARGMLLMFYADNDIITEVIPLTVSSYKYLSKSFEFSSVCVDLNYFTGLYNYYREAYPDAYPVYKSLALLFPAGDMARGLKELQSAATGSVVLGPESYYLLTWLYLNFENNYDKSLSYCRKLHERYPGNDLYFATYIKNLLLLKRFVEAEEQVSSVSDKEYGDYFKAQLLIFKAILQEKMHNDNKLAEQYYHEGIHNISSFGEYSNEYTAYAYFGLSRISMEKGDKQAGRIYRKQAEKLAEFKKINFDE